MAQGVVLRLCICRSVIMAVQYYWDEQVWMNKQQVMRYFVRGNATNAEFERLWGELMIDPDIRKDTDQTSLRSNNCFQS